MRVVLLVAFLYQYGGVEDGDDVVLRPAAGLVLVEAIDGLVEVGHGVIVRVELDVHPLPEQTEATTWATGSSLHQ